MQISRILGPMQISLSRMLDDVFQMLFLFLVTMLAFAVGLTRLLAYYKNSQRWESKSATEPKTQPERFDEYDLFTCSICYGHCVVTHFAITVAQQIGLSQM